MHIKANDTVFDANQFPIFFQETDGISFLSLDTMKLHIRCQSEYGATLVFSRIIGAIANGNRELLDLDRDFMIIDVFADHVTPIEDVLAA